MILKVVWRVLMGVLRVFEGCCRVFEVCLEGVWKNKIEVWNQSDPPPVNEMISQKIFFFTNDGFPKLRINLSFRAFATSTIVSIVAKLGGTQWRRWRQRCARVLGFHGRLPRIHYSSSHTRHPVKKQYLKYRWYLSYLQFYFSVWYQWYISGYVMQMQDFCSTTTLTRWKSQQPWHCFHTGPWTWTFWIPFYIFQGPYFQCLGQIHAKNVSLVGMYLWVNYWWQMS